MILLFLCLFLAALSLTYCIQKIQNYRQFQEEVASLQAYVVKSLQKKQKILSYQTDYSLMNPFFLEEEVEQLSLMDHEKKVLEKLVTMPFFRNHHKHMRRLELLHSPNYKLVFAKKKRFQKGLWEELWKAQQKSVEMSGEELLVFYLL